MPTVICRHIRTNGLRCGSPTLRERPYCFHHEHAHRHARSLVHKLDPNVPPSIIHSMQTDPGYMQREPLMAQYHSLKPGPITLSFPPLEDRQSIGVALSMVLSALAQKRIDAKEATPLIYGLQVASANAKGFRGFSEADAVTEITVDEYGDELAPDQDPIEKEYYEDSDDEDAAKEEKEDEKSAEEEADRLRHLKDQEDAVMKVTKMMT